MSLVCSSHWGFCSLVAVRALPPAYPDIAIYATSASVMAHCSLRMLLMHSPVLFAALSRCHLVVNAQTQITEFIGFFYMLCSPVEQEQMMFNYL